MADRPSNTGREDTVALPLPGKRSTPAPAPGEDSSGANGRVLPPMPPGQSTSPSTSNGARNGSGSSTPPPPPPQARPARTAAKKTGKPPAPPRPATAPAQARKAAPRKAAAPPRPAAPAPTTAAQPSLATQASPAARTTETARPAAAPPPVVAPAPAAKATPAQEPKPQKPTRADRKAERVAAVPRPGRRARLRLTRIDPWSVMKTSFLLSIALGIVIVVSVLMVWTVLGAADVWSSINQTVQDVVGGQDASTFDIEDYLGTRRVVGFTMIVAAIDVVLVTAICTLGAFLYNMSASLLGGVEVTLAEDR
jgi:hypothetical protein